MRSIFKIEHINTLLAIANAILAFVHVAKGDYAAACFFALLCFMISPQSPQSLG